MASVWYRRHPAPPPSHPQPRAPLVTVSPSARVDVFVLPIEIAPGDSIRTILQRDFDESDWLHVLPADSAGFAVAVVHATQTPAGLHIELIDGRTHRVYRSQEFSLPAPPTQSGRSPSFPASDSVVQAATEAQRWAVHGAADDVLQWITGRPGVAQSRIAYVSHGAIHVIDADGADDHVFPNSGIALSPAWSHDGHTLVYSNLTGTGTQLMELDLTRATSTRLASVAGGLNITPVYSPDDRWIVFAHGDERGTTLVSVQRNTATPPRVLLPRHGFDNASPVFRPDGQRLAFVSARPKTPQIYSVSADGTDERLETPFLQTVRSYRASPDWSPDGRTIAFEQQNGDFQIWLLTLADHSMHRLTSSGENEDPTWAPDSRHLAFTSSHNGAKEIWALDISSGRLRQITHTGAARLAAWSPILAKRI
jgi:TolB protein